LQIVHYECA